MVEIPKITIGTEGKTEAAKARAKEAEKRKKSAEETLEEAWARILAMKNSAKDAERLREVKRAMEAGEIGREPAPEGKRLGRFSKAEALRLYRELAERQREGKLRELVESTPENYELITTEERLIELSSQLLKEDVVAVDTETTGVDVYTDVIVGMSFTLPNADRNVYIPVDHAEESLGGITQIPLDIVLRELKPFLYTENVGKVLHNAMFDIAMFRRHGSDLQGVVWDTMTAMHLLNENESDRSMGGVGSFRLKDLAPRYLRVESDTFDELFGKDAQFREVPIDIALVYAAKDTELTWKLYEFQRKHMSKMPTILEYYETVEVPLLYVIVDLEANGYILDMEFAKEYGEELHKRAEELRKELIESLTPFHEGDDVINLNSNPQLKPALSKAIGKELPNLNAKQTLNPLRKDHEIIDKLLEYRDVTKLSSTYIDSLPTKQNPTTKRWHSRYNPIGTVTGRFSSGKDEDASTGREFNVQNQPDESRPMFVAPPGKVLVGADFKAQEIRCVAYLSGEPVLIKGFQEGKDPYATMASNFYGKPHDEVHKLPNGEDTPERKQMKVVWLATLYGMSDKKLGESLGVSREEATKFKEELFGSMPKLNAWLESNKEFVSKHGFVWADNKQRKRRLPAARWSRKKIPYGRYWDDEFKEERIHNAKIGTAFRQATNARVQGSSSIQTKVTMIKIHEYCATKPGWALWGSIHDECLLEVPEDITQEEVDEIRNLMLYSYVWGDGEVENGTDIEIGKRWGRMVSEEEWFANK